MIEGKKIRSAPAKPEPPRPYQVLLPLSSLEEARVLMPLAETLVLDRQGRLQILHITRVPDDTPLNQAAAEASRFRQALGALMTDYLYITAQVKTIVCTISQVWDEIWAAVERENIDLLLLAWQSPSLEETAVGDRVDPRLAAPPCDVVAMRHTPCWQKIERILLPVRGGPHAAQSLRLANALAEVHQASITLLHATSHAPRQAERNMLGAFEPALRSLKPLNRSVTVVSDVAGAIVQEAPDHQVVVMGAPYNQVHPDGWGGPLLDTLLKETGLALLVVKSKSLESSEPSDAAVGQEIPAVIEPRLAPVYKGDYPVSVVVDKWFAENTFHSQEFSDLKRLIALKEDQGLTISLGLPALNEAETVGNVIQTVKTALMEEVPLLDEIVLIDSGSVDYTREIAADLGIPVYIHQEILPEYGAYRGKGEALWKSLYVLRGDLVVWIDTDIKNIHPRFVYGVVGPLLRDPHIQYVKGFYRRPLRENEKLIAGGGGRVTELTARPLINLFFPDLSGLIQPLSGEYAGRRVALERVPFFSGYGVETGLLLDLLDEFGLRAIAQSDLLERVHHNQPLPSLSKMSFAILQVAISRLEKRHNIQLLEEANLTMNLIRYEPRRYFLETEEIYEVERPPMIRLPEYRSKHGRDKVEIHRDCAPGDSQPVIGELTG